ncbi:hypothetical protein [Celerinatantimonas sp. YJH-8]|uniref:hypothetical protein n=1 Tax=Celerinatantimonas sp. YJH-8 TaxID=3228714 RepID=UPI0038CA73A0
MKKKILFILLSILTLNFAMIGTSYALQYHKNSPLMFTFKSSHGYWFGCGPVQCTSSGNKTESKAMEYIYLPRKHGSPRQIGHYGRCTVYQSNGELSGGDYKTDWVIKRMKQKC